MKNTLFNFLVNDSEQEHLNSQRDSIYDELSKNREQMDKLMKESDNIS